MSGKEKAPESLAAEGAQDVTDGEKEATAKIVEWQGRMSLWTGYVQLHRTFSEEFILSDPKGYLLASLIALRARRDGRLKIKGCELGEAFLGVGDFQKMNMTEGEYRAAKERLSDLGMATFRGTNHGTIAKLIDTTIFDPNINYNNEPNNGRNNEQTTNEQRTDNDQATTNKKGTSKKESSHSYKKSAASDESAGALEAPPLSGGFSFWEGVQ